MWRDWRWWLLFSWPVASLAVLAYLNFRHFGPFDPADTLGRHLQNGQVEQRIEQLFNDVAGPTAMTVFQLSRKECQCNRYNEPLVEQVNTLLSLQGYKVVELSVDDYPQIAQWIPGFPSMAVFDDQQRLVYTGPYSSGYFCTPSTNVVADLITNLLASPYLGATINSDTTGCYCR